MQAWHSFSTCLAVSDLQVSLQINLTMYLHAFRVLQSLTLLDHNQRHL